MVLTGQIGLRRYGNSFIAKAIEWDTYSHTHHCVVAVSETHVFSAEPGGAVIRPMTDYPEIVWSNFDLTEQQRDDIVAGALALVGAPYNFAIFPILFLHRIFRARVPKWLGDWLEKRPHLDCSQATDIIYQNAGIQLLSGYNVLTTPGDIERVLIAYGFIAPDVALEREYEEVTDH